MYPQVTQITETNQNTIYQSNSKLCARSGARSITERGGWEIVQGSNCNFSFFYSDMCTVQKVTIDCQLYYYLCEKYRCPILWSIEITGVKEARTTQKRWIIGQECNFMQVALGDHPTIIGDKCLQRRARTVRKSSTPKFQFQQSFQLIKFSFGSSLSLGGEGNENDAMTAAAVSVHFFGWWTSPG